MNDLSLIRVKIVVSSYFFFFFFFLHHASRARCNIRVTRSLKMRGIARVSEAASVESLVYIF